MSKQLFLSDEKILEIASNPMAMPCSPWWLKSGVKFGDVQGAAIAFARAVLKAAPPAVQGEPVAWQRVDKPERIITKLYRRSITEAESGVEFIPLYAAPQPAEQQPAPEVAALDLTALAVPLGENITLHQRSAPDAAGLGGAYSDNLEAAAMQQSAPDVTQLVEALESAKNLIANHSGEVLPDEYAGDQIEQIEAVLAAYHNQGETP